MVAQHHLNRIEQSSPLALLQQRLQMETPQQVAQEIAQRLNENETCHALTELLTAAITALCDEDVNQLTECVLSYVHAPQENDNRAWYAPKPQESPCIEQAFRQAMQSAPAPISVSTEAPPRIYTDEEAAAF